MRILATIAVFAALAACAPTPSAPAGTEFLEDIGLATLMEDCHAPFGWQEMAAQGRVQDCDAYLFQEQGILDDDAVRFIAAVDPVNRLVLITINDPSGMTTTWQSLDAVQDFNRVSRATDGQAYRDAAARFMSYAAES